MRRIISICKEVPLLPIAIIAAIPLVLLGSWRPWEAAGVSLTFGPFNPGVGQWIVIALVVYTIVVTVIGMIDDYLLPFQLSGSVFDLIHRKFIKRVR